MTSIGIGLAQEPAQREQVAAAVEDVLSRREFQEERSLLADLVEWVLERIDFDGEASFLGELLFWFLLALLTALALYFGLRFFAAGRRQRRERLAAEGARGPGLAERVLRLRREAARSLATGELRLALRKNLFALILGLGGRGDLEYRDAWTNRELLLRGRPAPEMRDMLAAVITELEAKEFGRVEVHRADVERLQALCERYLGALEEAAA